MKFRFKSALHSQIGLTLGRHWEWACAFLRTLCSSALTATHSEHGERLSIMALPLKRVLARETCQPIRALGDCLVEVVQGGSSGDLLTRRLPNLQKKEGIVSCGKVALSLAWVFTTADWLAADPRSHSLKLGQQARQSPRLYTHARDAVLLR